MFSHAPVKVPWTNPSQGPGVPPSVQGKRQREAKYPTGSPKNPEPRKDCFKSICRPLQVNSPLHHMIASFFLMKNIFRVLGECGSRSSLCSLVRVLESDCLALLHTENSFKHLAQCSQLQEVSTFHDSKPLNCDLVQKMLLYVLK